MGCDQAWRKSITMCGLFASVGFDPNPAWLDIVAHRGPDGRGLRVFESRYGPVMLGHRRLSIIDLDARADQPMASPDGRLWLAYNGEIYNYVELRAELISLGESFVTQSDTEVLLRAYWRWGEAAFDRLKGMFAIVIYDAQNQTLQCVRDRFGIKPLYFWQGGQGIAFASEIKQLTTLPGFSARMNRARMADFVQSGYTDHTSETLFADVFQVRGGEMLRLDLSTWRPGQAPSIRRWYDIPRTPGPPLSEAEASEQFRALFLESVRMHLRADVRVGSCLSGGLDSSAIVVAMARQLRSAPEAGRIHTVSACYPNKEVDEKPFMDSVVAASNTIPHFVYPQAADAFTLAEKITFHQDEPYGSTSIFAQWCVFEEAKRQGIKVMLDGQGADEQLAGYHGSFWFHAQSLLRRRDGMEILRMLADRARWHGLNPIDNLRQMYGHKAPPWLKRGIRSALHLSPGAGYAKTAFLEQAAPPETLGMTGILAREGIGQIRDIGDLSVAFIKAASLPMLLRYEDRNSMAHAIEARVPFLDHDLVEFNVRLWDQHKIVGGDTKRVLRQAMTGLLPQAVRNRRDKLGFATPEQAWFRGPLRPLVHDGIEDTLRLYPDLFDPNETRTLRDAMLDGRRPLDFTLWRIINIGLWGRLHKVAL
jgi:asparagine synthase (glutamine-hydrolysing)